MDSPLLEDEKFDFDLPLSPEEFEERDQDEEDDEIFFGPVSHNERCVAANTETKVSKYIDEVESIKPLSPLNPEQVVEIFKEATSISLMFRTSCSEAVLGDQDKPRSDFPELITDVAESKRRALKCENTKENEDSTTKILEDSKQLSEKLSEKNEDNFVVRKRVLKERNVKSNVNKESPKSTGTKPHLVGKGQTAMAQNKANGSISKLHKFKKNSKPTYQNSKSDIKKSSMGTPRTFSSSSGKADRSFSSTKSSSTSDTSFTEESTKQSKLPMPSQSGLKAPGFTGRRKRTSSNSSTSSTSSTSALNETFTVTKSSGSPNSTKQSKSKIFQPNPKPLLTKIGLSKPTFAKPSEVSKTSKLQPLKALQRAPVGSARSMSATGLKSPAQTKSISRAVSAGSTPLRAQTPKADRTPSKGTTPIRRRSSMNTSANITAKKKQTGLLAPNDIVKKPNTPTVRKNAVGKGGRVGKSTIVTASTSVAVQRRNIGETKGERKNEKSGKDTKLTTPERRLDVDEKCITTPKNTGEKQRNSQLSRSVNCKKRRSFIPTPNLNRTMEPQKNVDSDSPKAPSPVPFHLSPTLSNQCDKAESSEENTEPNVVLNFNLSNEEKDLNVAVYQSPESKNQEQVSDKNLCDNQPSDNCETKSPDRDIQIQELDLMIQETPPVITRVSGDDFADPFSPGIPTPDLPSDDCLNPVVLQIDTKDLIDLSHMSPKPETDLIDLAAESPVHLIEAKLVDI